MHNIANIAAVILISMGMVAVAVWLLEHPKARKYYVSAGQANKLESVRSNKARGWKN